MGLSDLKAELKRLDKKELVEILSELYKNNKSVKEYFDFYLNPNGTDLFKKYQSVVFEAFYPKRGYCLKLSVAKKAISDFKKIGGATDLVCDLMLFYVETGIKFTNDFGDINEPFYDSLETTYRKALELMKKNDFLGTFKNRAYKAVTDTSDIGWNFHDTLMDTYFKYYDNELTDK